MSYARRYAKTKVLLISHRPVAAIRKLVPPCTKQHRRSKHASPDRIRIQMQVPHTTFFLEGAVYQYCTKRGKGTSATLSPRNS